MVGCVARDMVWDLSMRHNTGADLHILTRESVNWKESLCQSPVCDQRSLLGHLQ
jgi:hypothetical protein